MRNSLPLPQATDFSWKKMLPVLLIGGGALVAMIGSALIGITGQGTWIIIGLIGIAAGMMMVLRPAFGICVLVAFVYLNLSDVIEVTFGIPSLNKILVALIFVGVLGTRAVIQKKPISIRLTEVLMIVYGLVIILTGLVSKYPEVIFANLVDYAKDLAIVLILVQVCDNEHVWKAMQWVVILCASFLAMLTCYQVLTGDTQNTFWGLANAPVHEIVENVDGTRPTGPLEDPNFYSQILLMVLPMATYRVIGEKSRFTRYLALSGAGMIVLAVIFTYSRAAFLMMMAITVLIIQERKMNIYKLTLMAVVILALVSPLLPKGYLDRINTLGGGTTSSTGATEDSFKGRSSEMIIATEMFLDHPLLGVGYAEYDMNYQEYSRKLGMDNRTEDREAHSLYLEAAAETGLIGLAVFIGMYAAIFFSMHRARQSLKAMNRLDLIPWVWGLQFGLISYLLTSIFLHDGYVRYLRLSMALCVSATAMVEGLVRQHNEEKRKRGYV